MPNTPEAESSVLLARPIPRIHGFASVLLFLALAAFFIEVVVRPVFALTLLASLLGVAAESGVLKDMGSLDAQNFEETLALGFFVPFLAITLGLGWRAIRLVGSELFKAEPLSTWRPTQITMITGALLAFVCFVLFPLNRAHFVDSDGALVGGGIVAADFFLCWLVGWAVVCAAWWCVRRLWTACQTRPVLAGMTIVLAGGPAVVVWTADHLLTAALRNSSNETRVASAAFDDAHSLEAVRQGLLKVAAANKEMVSALTTSAPPPGGSGNAAGGGGNTLFGGTGGDGDDPFARCIHELQKKPPEPSAVQEAHVSFDPDLIQETLIAVCLHERTRPVRDLVPYFFRSLKNSRAKHETRRLNRCRAEEGFSCRVPWPEEAAQAASHASVEAMLCQLSDLERAVVILDTYGEMSGPEIGQRLNISADYARRVLSDARRKLRDLYSQECE